MASGVRRSSSSSSAGRAREAEEESRRAAEAAEEAAIRKRIAELESTSRGLDSQRAAMVMSIGATQKGDADSYSREDLDAIGRQVGSVEEEIRALKAKLPRERDTCSIF